MVVVDHRIGGKGEVCRSARIIDAAAIAGGAFVVVIVGDGQFRAFFKNAFAVVGQTAAIVIGDGNHCACFHLAVGDAGS